MVSIVKSEWHSVERRYGATIDEDFLLKVYEDMGPGEASQMLQNIKDGLVDIEDVLNDAFDAGVDIDWDWLDEDDWWTDRKGGYEVTYEVSE